MPVVTDIQRQKKRETRYSIYLDNVYRLSLSDLELSHSGLRIGQELVEAEIVELERTSGEGKAYGRALDWLSRRKRSRREIQDYLRKHDYSDVTIAAVMERLVAVGLVDDADLARSWVADRTNLRPRSRRQLAAELMAKGVNGADLEAGLAEVSTEAELANLRSIIDKKISLPRYSERDKLINYLMSQGFAYDDIRRVLDEA